MVRKVRFPLEMKNGVKVRTIEELRENFDLESVVMYFINGKLATWLRDRGYEEEAEQIEQINKDEKNFVDILCEILGVHNATIDTKISLKNIEEKNLKLTKLKMITDNEEYLNNVDKVAFNSQELNKLINEGKSKIYLCGDKFEIPVDRSNIAYIGVNKPTVVINSNKFINFKKNGVIFNNVILDENYNKILRRNNNHCRISSGVSHIVGLTGEGTVVAVGNNDYDQCNVEKWKDIIAISAGSDHTVGLKEDGTVVAVGDNSYGQCDIKEWKNIVAISAGNDYTVGLKEDGKIEGVGIGIWGILDINNWKL